MTDPKKLRVLFCHFTADVSGGSDRSLFDLVTHLPQEQFAPVVVLKKGDPLAERYRESNIPTYEITLVSPRRALDAYKFLKYAIWFIPSVINILLILNKEKTQVVHINTLYNLQGAFAAHLSKRPLVWHIRELVPDSRVVALFLGCVRRWADKVIPNSHAVAESVSACGSRVHVIHNGVDLREYESLPKDNVVREEFACSPNDPVVCVIGRLEPWKGQHVLLEAFPGVLAAHPNAHLWIVGGVAINKVDYLPKLKTRATELGVDKRVCFTGIRNDIPIILASCTILVLPSVTPEPFGRTIIEAMAAGCPVIASRQGGPLEIVREESTGFLVEPDDPDALTLAICKLLDEPSLAKRFGENGKKIAFKHFSLERVVREMADILKGASRL